MSEPMARYLNLHATGELRRRAEALEGLLGPVCRVCPRRCRVDRRAGGVGVCFAGAQAEVASWCDHHGEEPPVSGTRGSGTIFFSHCNLRCVFCQNYQISQHFERPAAGAGRANGLADDELAEIMLDLQRRGCHNINLVSPSHVVPQIVAALDVAASRGLTLPIVYNSNGYDSLETLRLLDGVIDIYLPDLKYGDDAEARRYSRAPGYVGHARAAIAGMWRQTGPLRLDGEGVAWRGMIVRHLVLPNALADSEDCLDWLRETCGPDVPVSLMAQYYPAHLAARYPLLNRRLRPTEYGRVVAHAQRLGFEHLLVQDEMLAPEFYRPDFTREHPFAGQ